MTNFVETIQTIPWSTVLGTTPLSITATVSAVIGVFLIARQNILGWPLGLVWAAISAYLCYTEWDLVSDGILYLSYIPIQIYCWYVWAKNGGPKEEKPFVPVWSSRKAQIILIVASVACIAIWALGISKIAANVAWLPTPALLIRDSTTTVLNYFSQFLQAKKRMENWIGWLVVNILGIHIYWVKDAPIYSVQYAFFLCLGIYGWMQWHKSMKPKTN